MTQIVSPVEPETEAQSVTQAQALGDYARYLQRVRGLTAGTIRRCIRTVHDLLKACFGSGPVLWDQMRAGDVTRFLLRSTQHVTSNAAKKMASHLRQFLRYLQAHGKIPQNLAGAVPPVAGRDEVRSLPCFLEPEELRRVLASCDLTSAKGQRDHAILLLLARLGLRSCEVVAMELSDIDWRAGVLTLRGKGPRLERLPLPQEVGEALASYLRQARPTCASARVFVRLQPSVEGFSGSSAISGLVRQALRRSGLAPKHQGAHLLTPYIYTDEEIERLLQAARALPSATGMAPASYTTLFALLAATGMRVGEAVHLDGEDVDLDQALLTLRRTKLSKHRLVPIHPSTCDALRRYQCQRDRIYPSPSTPRFFLAERGGRLREGVVGDVFRKLSRQIGLRGPSQSRGPRLHDLRHRFAVRTVIGWYRLGVDVEAQIPKLATYLGHSHVNDTYWYLTAVPELMQWAVARLDEEHHEHPIG